jgi:hypothetical protein
MNIAHDLLDDLAGIGATIEPAGDRLVLRRADRNPCHAGRPDPPGQARAYGGACGPKGLCRPPR